MRYLSKLSFAVAIIFCAAAVRAQTVPDKDSILANTLQGRLGLTDAQRKKIFVLGKQCQFSIDSLYKQNLVVEERGRSIGKVNIRYQLGMHEVLSEKQYQKLKDFNRQQIDSLRARPKSGR